MFPQPHDFNNFSVLWGVIQSLYPKNHHFAGVFPLNRNLVPFWPGTTDISDFKWLLKLDDSKSLHRKWFKLVVFRRWVFGVPVQGAASTKTCEPSS